MVYIAPPYPYNNSEGSDWPRSLRKLNGLSRDLNLELPTPIL